MSAYEQLGHDDTLAWVTVAKGEHQGQPLSVRCCYTRSKDGRLRFDRMEADVQNDPICDLHLENVTDESGNPAVTATLLL
jgi:hypothetical protein